MTLLTAAAHFEHGPVSVTLYFRNAQIMGKRCVPGHTQCESPESNPPKTGGPSLQLPCAFLH